MCTYLTMQATPGDKVVSSFGRLTDTGNAGTHSSSHIQGICAWLARLDFQEFLSVHLSFVRRSHPDSDTVNPPSST